MAYKQKHKYGYRDSLEKGDPEKVIMGADLDDEFEAIEESLASVPGAGAPLPPDAPGYGEVVFQTRAEDQQVVSKFTFAVDGQEPLTVENTGIWAGVNYVKYVSADTTWKVLPGLEVEGDLSVSGSTHLEGSLEVDGSTQLNADLNVDGNIDATGGISLDGDLAIGGQIEGDLTVNGNITIDGGGSIIYPDGTTGLGEAPQDGNAYARQDATWVSLGDDLSGYDDTWIQPALDLKADQADFDALVARVKALEDADYVPKSGDSTITGTLTATDMVATG